MECVIACGTSIAAKIAEYTVAPVGRQLGYIFLYRRNVDNLKTETQDLDRQIKRMEVSVDKATRKGDEIHDDIKDWLSNADKISQDAAKLLGDDNTTEIKCTFKGTFSYLASRYQLGKKAKEMRESVVEIKGKNKLDNISFRPNLPSNFENKDYLKSVTREKFMDEIMKVLGDGNVRTIGLHGMPGVGKTTLVKEIARNALAKDCKLFHDAVIVTVSQNPDIEKIQQQIVERLDLKLRKKTISERALELKNRLNGEMKFLIVLDDLWNELKLEDVGIAFEGDQKGCKILITSRFEGVLGTDMEVDKNLKVELLSEDEALSWFNVIVGDATKTLEFRELGTKIVKKCGCLPLAIITVAQSLKKQELPMWRDAWTRLENSEQNEVVSSAIKLCYNILESDETKKLVSLCSLHKEDANIQMEYLMRNCWGMGMFKGNMTLQNARDRVYGWVNTLKDRCLLLDGDHSGTVKMHDVVRDITISIAKESDNMHCFRDGDEVEEFVSKEKKLEDLKAILLPNGYLDEVVFRRLENAQLQLMICMGRKSSKIIPGDFLDSTKQLRVLDFSGQVFDYPKLLASHLSPLQNPRTLRLCNSDVEDIAEIGKLKNLEILDLSGCQIKKLPGEIGQLTRLRMLDLRGCYHLEVIEPNVILHLKRLEELYVDRFQNWHKVDQVENGERRNAGFDELKHLVHLTALHIHVSDIEMLPEVLLSQKLERYDVRIGTCNYGFSQYSGSRRSLINHTESSILRKRMLEFLNGLYDIVSKLDTECYDTRIGAYNYGVSQYSGSRDLLINHTERSILRKHGFEMLMKKSERLWLEGLNGLNNIVSDLDTEGFLELKSLGLKSNNTIQYLVNSMGQICHCVVLGSLETLFLDDLSNLKQLCHGEVTVESFKTLRVVTVSNCKSLKKLLPLFNARQLEEIEIVDCEEMEEIFTHQIQEDDDDNKEELLQLRSLKLEGVSKLIEFCSKRLLKKIGSTSEKEEEPFVGDSVMPLFNGKFLCFPKLETLKLSGCHVKKLWDDQLVPSSTSFCCLTELVVDNCKHLKCVVPSSTAANFKQLFSLEVRGCEAMEEIVSRDERMEKMSFPKLYSMELKDLPRLSKFSSGIFIEFPMLNDLHIGNCPELKTFVSDSSEDKSNTTMPSFFNENFVCFPTLEKLELSGCNVKKLWADQLLPSFISFCCLTELVVDNCKHLKCVFSSSTAASFKQLYSLKVISCRAMEEIVSRDERMDKISFPKLYSCKLEDLPRLCTFSSGIFIEFPMLNDLHIGNCPELKTFVSESSEDKSNTTMPSLFNENYCPAELKTFVSKSSEGSSLFDERVSFPSLKIVNIADMDGLKMIWHRELSTNADSFCKLENVEVANCQNLMKIFPFGMHTRLHNLTQLRIDKCEMVEEIFEIQTSSAVEIIRTQLNSLELYDLSNLKYVWSKDPRGTFTFPNLKRVGASYCPNLKAIFPLSVAKGLSQLSDLSIQECGIEEIVNNEEGLETIPPYHFVFPQLEEMNFRSLPKFVSFYAEPHTSTFPLLKRLTMEDCYRELKVLFSSEIFNFQRRHGSVHCDIPIQQQPLFFITPDKVAFPSLKSVRIKDMNGLKMIWQYGLCTNADSFCKLEEVNVQKCKNLMGIFPFSMHRSLGNLKSLEIINCEMVEEIFEIQTYSNSEEIHDMIISTQLKYLVLRCLPNLKYVWSKDPHGTFTFPNVEKVEAVQCPNLKAIFPPSVAKCLSQLSKLYVEECGIEEIFGKQQVLEAIPPHDHQFVFPQLQTIELKSLPNLVSFNERPYISRFPLLRSLEVKDCLKVKVCFSSDLLSFQFRSKHGSSAHDDIPIQQPLFFTDNVAFPSLEYVYIHDMYGLKRIWQYELCTNNADSFCKLEELKVEHCENLMGIFPSGMHTRLGNLTRLEIRDCEMVEEIFEMETFNSEDDLVSTELKYLELHRLSNLKYVWSKDPQGTFMFPKLEKVRAFECGNLKAIFPPSVAKQLSQLVNLSIENCGIEEVVGKQDRFLETVTPDDEFVFPQLQIMELIDLPNLVNFYAGTHTVRFPLLEKLEVNNCLKVKAFSSLELLSYPGRHESLFSTKVTFGRDLKYGVILCELPNVMHLMEEEEKSSQHQPQTLVFSDLTDLQVVRCEGLKKLVPSSISFQNLNSLLVSDCHGMLHLLSSQTAKTMTQLTSMIIKECERMEEIIADAGVDCKGGEIVFTRLKYLVLDDLPRLASFYSGNYTMTFPNLKGLGVQGCFEMQSFSKHGTISTPKMKKIIIDDIDYGEAKSDFDLKLESEIESETESSSNRTVDINSIIAKHWMSLQDLSTDEEDIAPSNPSEE